MSDLDERDLLTRELRERSHDVGGHPVGLDAVKARAGGIRRRRNIVSGVVAAVAASIALPTGLAVTGGLTSDGSVRPPHVASTPSEQPAPRPDGTFPLTLRGLPGGRGPEVPYIDNRVPAGVTEGGSVRTPARYQQITRYADGWLALANGGDSAEMFMLDDNMRVQRSFRSGESFAVSTDGSQVAYVEIRDDGSQYLVDAPTDGGDVQGWSFPRSPMVWPVGLVAKGTVVYEAEGGQGSEIGLVSAEGRTKLEGFLSVDDADTVNGLVAGLTSWDPAEGACFGVMDPAASTTDLVWETCDHALTGFSPDGRYLLGTDPEADGLGSPSLAVIDARTHEVVVEFSAGRGDRTVVAQATWEDEDTVLAMVSEGGRFVMERFELDGHVETATEPGRTEEAFQPLPVRFGARAW